MPSKSRRAFDQNAQDAERLLEIHRDLGGDAKGRRFRLEVLNKSAIVLITAIWEAYCEDIAAEALDHIVSNVPAGANLPKELKKRIAQEIKKDSNDLAMWGLADAGWRARVRSRLATLTEERNRKLNTPKWENIDELFLSVIGLNDVSGAWFWKKMSPQQARKKLDKYVSLRGAIAHRGAAASSCKKTHVKDYFDHVKRLVSKTGPRWRVNSFVKTTTGKPLW